MCVMKMHCENILGENKNKNSFIFGSFCTVDGASAAYFPTL